MKTSFLPCALIALLALPSYAQVNSGSDGHDGALNPTANLVIDMADHPDGIYHYTSVNIPTGVTVSFIPNSGNKPVVWLVQGAVTIAGTVTVSGSRPTGGAAGSADLGDFGAGLLPEAEAWQVRVKVLAVAKVPTHMLERVVPIMEEMPLLAQAAVRGRHKLLPAKLTVIYISFP